jgi:hypothetical protein
MGGRHFVSGDMAHAVATPAVTAHAGNDQRGGRRPEVLASA